MPLTLRFLSPGLDHDVGYDRPGNKATDMGLPGNPRHDEPHHQVQTQDDQQLNIRATKRSLNDKQRAKESENRSRSSDDR